MNRSLLRVASRMFCCVLVSLAASCGTAFAQATPGKELAAFLESGESDVAVLSPAALIDRRAEYVIALAAIKNRQYDEALSRLEAATTRERTNLAAWRGKFWLLTYRKNFDHAIAQMKQLTLLFPERAASDAIDQELQITAHWMGQLCEYMAVPSENASAATAADQIQQRLTGAYRDKFEQGREEVRKVYQDFAAEIEASRADDETTAAEKAENAEEFIANERERVATERNQIESNLSDVQKQAEQAAADIDKGFAPLQTQLQNLNLMVTPIRSRIASLQNQYSDSIAQTARIQDPVLQEAIRGQADAILIRLRREQELMRPFELEAFRVQSEINRLMRQKAAVGMQYQAHLNQAGNRQESLSKTEKNLNRQEKKPPRNIVPSSTRTRGLQAKATSLTSYQSFPLEEERIRMLQKLRL